MPVLAETCGPIHSPDISVSLAVPWVEAAPPTLSMMVSLSAKSQEQRKGWERQATHLKSVSKIPSSSETVGRGRQATFNFLSACNSLVVEALHEAIKLQVLPPARATSGWVIGQLHRDVPHESPVLFTDICPLVYLTKLFDEA